LIDDRGFSGAKCITVKKKWCKLSSRIGSPLGLTPGQAGPIGESETKGKGADGDPILLLLILETAVANPKVSYHILENVNLNK
jgi:hypothetical protein